MPNWETVLKDTDLEKIGKDCSTTRELADALGDKLGESVTVDSLFNAHKRHRKRLKLKPSLRDYMGAIPEAPVSENDKKPVVKPEDIKFSLSDEKKKEVAKAKRFIITSALNNVSLHKDAWASVKAYAKSKDACILVVPSRYRNPTSKNEAEKRDLDAWWPAEVEPHMTDELIALHDQLWLMAHVRVQATAVNPLSGLEALSQGASAIFGHAQLALQMVPTPQHQFAKMLVTTGSISEPVYSDTKAGIRGNFHHTLGALVVERNDQMFYPPRNVLVDDDGGFYDLDEYFSKKGVRKVKHAAGLVLGDEHVEFNDPKCKAATYTNEDSIVNTLKPEILARHDVIDAYSISHHNRKDLVVQIAKHRFGRHRLVDELEDVREYIDETTPPWAENWIVPSNHHDHILKWLKEVHPLDEPWNADIWFELWEQMRKTIDWSDSGTIHDHPFALWLGRRLKSKTRFLPRDAPDTIKGILVGLHGDQGNNGSRGSIIQFARLGVKTITGHSHTPGIKQGAFVVGTGARLKLEYTHGPSSWAQCHCVIYPNGKRALLFVVNGVWRLNDEKRKPKTRKSAPKTRKRRK